MLSFTEIFSPTIEVIACSRFHLFIFCVLLVDDFLVHVMNDALDVQLVRGCSVWILSNSADDVHDPKEMFECAVRTDRSRPY